MKKISISGLLSLWATIILFGQTNPDTAIYEVAEQLPYPLLASCQPEQHPGWTLDSIRGCAEPQLLALLAKNIRYPEEARQQNIEGTVVTSFVVEKNGQMSGISILKDIGGGCGDEAARVLGALGELGLRWKPAMRGGKSVRMRQALPVRFKLQEALPYYLAENGDTIYVNTDTPVDFPGGADSLIAFVLNRLEYPVQYIDSCKTGVIEMAVLIRPNGNVEISNQLDFNNLGSDFLWKAIQLVNNTAGYWTAATYHGKPVTTTVPLRVLFKSSSPGCAQTNARFDQAMILADEGANLANQNETDKAIEKWTQALALQPDNTELMYYRGSAYLGLNKREEACQDFNQIKRVLGLTWFEPLRRLACGW